MLGRLETKQARQSTFLHILAGDGVLVVTMILAMVGFSVADGIGQEFVISLIRGFLSFERSNFLAFCFSSGTGIGCLIFYRTLAMI